MQATTSQAKGQGGVPVIHVRGRDRRSEKPEPIPKMQAPTTQIKDQVGQDTFSRSVEDYSLLKELGMIEETETEELAGYFEGMKKIASIEDHAPEGDIHFEEGPVGRDLERPHQNRSLMSKWEAKVPRRSNPAYAFNDMVEEAKKYKEIPYMPKLIASARQEMTRVF